MKSIQKYFVSFLTFSIILVFSGNANSRDVYASVAFCASGGDVSFNCPNLFRTPDEVFTKYKALYQYNSTPEHGTEALRFYPDVDSGTTNGWPTYYAFDVRIYGIDQHGSPYDEIWSWPGKIWTPALCPQSRYTESYYVYGVPSSVKNVICYGYEQPAPDPGCEKCQLHFGNPVYPATGTKFQNEIDYVGSGSNELTFSRTYRSDQRGWSHNYQSYGVDFTALTLSTFVPCYFDLQRTTFWPRCFRYAATGLSNDFMVKRSGQRALDFGTAIDLSAATDISDRVTKIVVDNLTVGFDVYNSIDESIERFNTTGSLQSVTSRSGRVKTLSYSDSTTPDTIASSAGLLILVADEYGRALHFTYDSADRMTTMTDPSGAVTKYGYDESTSIVKDGRFAPGNPTSVTYPDGKKRLYWYNEQDRTSGADLPFSLTGITDELGTRFATFAYDDGGRAISTEHAGGVEKFTFTFPSLWSKSAVTDPLGTVRTYTFQTILGSSKNTGTTQPGPGRVGSVSSSMSYDTQGNLARSTDFSGVVTTFAYDLTRNLETRRVEAAGTLQERITTTEWHPSFRLPTRIAEPQRLTIVSYDASGNVVRRAVQATADLTGAMGTRALLLDAPRLITYTYNSAGQLLTESGPRTDVANTTTYTYDFQGNLATVIDAANHVMTFQNYDANGRVGRIVAANGIMTDLKYWPRGWLKQRTVTAGGANETTSYDYDGAGQLKIVTLPDQSTMRYDYDDAHRLTSVTDSMGNKFSYTYDLASNRILDQVTDPANVLTGKVTRVYDALNLLRQQTGGTQ